MKEDTVKVKYKDNPVLLDKVIQNIQKALFENIVWLDYSFGRAYKMVEHRPDGNKFIYPAIYNGNGEYVSLLPNDNFGNFSWFDIYDPQEINEVVQSMPQLSFNGAIIFWYKIDDIYEDKTLIYSEEIKNEVVSLLTTPGLVDNGRITINKVYERFENIYKGYSLEKIYNSSLYKGEDVSSIDKQFFMYPYVGLRIEFNITTRELCQRYTK